ncbi:hypothetical protein TKK_0003011 [Trichogramma kaykai]
MRIFSRFRGKVVCISPLQEHVIDGELRQSFTFDVKNKAGMRIRCTTHYDFANRCARVIKPGVVVSMRNIFVRSSQEWHLMGNRYKAVVNESARLRYVAVI